MASPIIGRPPPPAPAAVNPPMTPARTAAPPPDKTPARGGAAAVARDGRPAHGRNRVIFRDARAMFRDAHGTFRDAQASFRDAQGIFRDARRALGDAHAALRDAPSMFRDAQGMFVTHEPRFVTRDRPFLTDALPGAAFSPAPEREGPPRAARCRTPDIFAALRGSRSRRSGSGRRGGGGGGTARFARGAGRAAHRTVRSTSSTAPGAASRHRRGRIPSAARVPAARAPLRRRPNGGRGHVQHVISEARRANAQAAGPREHVGGRPRCPRREPQHPLRPVIPGDPNRCPRHNEQQRHGHSGVGEHSAHVTTILTAMRLRRVSACWTEVSDPRGTVLRARGGGRTDRPAEAGERSERKPGAVTPRDGLHKIEPAWCGTVIRR